MQRTSEHTKAVEAVDFDTYREEDEETRPLPEEGVPPRREKGTPPLPSLGILGSMFSLEATATKVPDAFAATGRRGRI